MPPPRLSSRPWLMDAALIGCSCLTDRYEGRPCQPPYYPNRFICSTGGTGSSLRITKAVSFGKTSPGGPFVVSLFYAVDAGRNLLEPPDAHARHTRFSFSKKKLLLRL